MPGLLFSQLFTSGCTEVHSPGLCTAATTPISEIQGEGYYSPLVGTRHVVRGAVTAIEQGSGFYIEQDARPQPAGSSHALFIDSPELSLEVGTGQQVALAGVVGEAGQKRDKLTVLTGVDAYAICAENVALPLTIVDLPLDNPGREALEGMRVAFEQELSVTDVYSQYRGMVTLSAGGAMRVPTEDAAPGKPAGRLARENRNRSVAVLLNKGFPAPVATGAVFRNATGVLGHDGRNQILLLNSGDSQSVPPPDAIEPPSPGSLRVVNANLLNFFNGDGRGGGFPTERGAESGEEFRAQKDRIRSAMGLMKPDLLAVQELENDGFGPYSAAAELKVILDENIDGGFEFITRPGEQHGTDVITVGLFYRTETLEPVGTSQTLDSAPFIGLSRQPLAQVFRDKHSGRIILVVVNHLKSKGSCPDSGVNSDQRDGQGCWNPARTEAVRAILPWLEQLASEAGTDHVLILGDMNAYRLEDPIRQFVDGGFTELVEHHSGLPQYSYLFYGQAGTLDYAFASPSLARFSRKAEIWHINADWPRNMALPQPWLRMSDHDPVIIDFEFNQNR